MGPANRKVPPVMITAKAAEVPPGFQEHGGRMGQAETRSASLEPGRSAAEWPRS
jgi:hypothetical protein